MLCWSLFKKDTYIMNVEYIFSSHHHSFEVFEAENRMAYLSIQPFKHYFQFNILTIALVFRHQ